MDNKVSETRFAVVVRRMLTVAGVLGMSAFSESALAATYTGKVVTEVQTSVADCFYFRLEGVTQVDPPSSGNWFGVSLASQGAKDILAMVLSARLTGTPVTVITTGTMVCGTYAQATHVVL